MVLLNTRLRAWSALIVALCSAPLGVVAQRGGQPAPGSFPHAYPGQPSGDFSPAWQNYFQVNASQLPNVTFNLGRSFAGNIGVNRAGHPNNTLFFWGFEKSNGSLTSTNSTEPWGIWLNGGPGSSSMLGLFFENGPIRMNSDLSLSAHNQSWDRLADYIWIDQPVGTGFSTADANGYVPDENQMGKDFMGFLTNLVKVFPGLATRPLHLTGESYAGTYIPYILKTYFETEKPPVKLTKIAIGDGTVGSAAVFEYLPTLTTLQTYPQLIGYDQEVFKYFQTQSQLCGFNVNLTYPQNGILPTIPLQLPPRFQGTPLKDLITRKNFILKFQERVKVLSTSLTPREPKESIELRKRDLSGRANGTIDPWYGCLLFDEFIDYAVNFTFPWSTTNGSEFNVYDIPISAVNAPVTPEASGFLNDNRVRTAIHAPTSKDWTDSINFPFGTDSNGQDIQDPSPEPMTFLTELASNATSQGVGIILYSGNDDSLVAHRGTEVVIQNTTFGGIQGFTRKPATQWFTDAGEFAGVVHQERNWTYVLFKGASHLVPANVPDAAFVFLREFVLGSNTTGLVTNSSGGVSVTGGENAPLDGDIMRGSDEIFYGTLGKTSTFTFPSATVSAWNNFIQTATGSAASSASSASGSNKSNSGRRDTQSGPFLLVVLGCLTWLYTVL